MKLHRLKTWSDSYDAIAANIQRFEIRETGRDFQAGDVLVLERWDPDTRRCTGEHTWRAITLVTQGPYGVPSGLCVLSLTLEGERPPGWDQATLEAFRTQYNALCAELQT